MMWSKLIRIAVKTAIFFVLCNLVYALVSPLDALGRVSVYNTLIPGRARLPYGENPTESYNLSLTNIPAMFASHEISRPKAGDEFRVVVIGDSGTWGWLLESDQTVAAQLEALGYTSDDGRRVEVYNLGYPGMALAKDLLMLHQVMEYQPDAVIWLVTAQSFPIEQQIELPVVQKNRFPIALATNAQYSEAPRLESDPPSFSLSDPRFVTPDLTLLGQRRELADWLRLQLYSFAWAATGIDQALPEEITLRQSDFEADYSWFGHAQEEPLDDLAFDVLQDGLRWTEGVPLLFVNEPIYISSGQNSDIRYNSFYPRWAYDQYRELLGEPMQGRNYLDLWDVIPPDEFTDTPVHLTPEGTRMLAERIGAELESLGWVRR